MQLANGAFAVFFNGKYTGAVGKENWKGFSEEVNPANVFELYRSQEPGKSDFVKEDIVSLEGTAYLHPLIANLQPGGLPIVLVFSGGVIKIAVLLARPLEVIFVTRESKPMQWKLTINRKQGTDNCRRGNRDHSDDFGPFRIHIPDYEIAAFPERSCEVSMDPVPWTGRSRPPVEHSLSWGLFASCVAVGEFESGLVLGHPLKVKEPPGIAT
ncbi:unnamed protein product [Toxocara canis]|uniref:Phosphatase n=1 Tax=Toxocara canis TaxID=6265 RepID=A0A183VBW8_TOXCA|nr:unnamed protein product [Toxocara canis]